MSQGKHDQVAQAFAERLSLIRQANSYSCDIGLDVRRGKGTLDDSAGFVVLFEGEEDVLSQSKSKDATACKVRVPYVVEAQVIARDVLNPNPTGHAVADDICRALWPEGFVYPRDLLTGVPAYAGRLILPRQEGRLLVVVQVKFHAEFVFNPGNP